jgi:exodeoxyribonuclease V alpha subunit
MNRGGVGTRALNIALQKALNPLTDRKVERFGWTFVAGDKVMQIEDDYDNEVYNGDIGFVEDVDTEGGELTAIFDSRAVTSTFDELDTLALAYASTIHKSQSCEYPVVVIPVMTQHYTMLQRNLLYTGVTRGKRLVVLVGQKEDITTVLGLTSPNGSQAACLRSALSTLPSGIIVSAFPRCSRPRLLTAAARRGLSSQSR